MRAERPELVARMRRSGLLHQDIADTAGVSKATVINDLKVSSDFEAPTQITKARGQQRPATYTPRPAPITPPQAVDAACPSCGASGPSCDSVRWLRGRTCCQECSGDHEAPSTPRSTCSTASPSRTRSPTTSGPSEQQARGNPSKETAP